MKLLRWQATYLASALLFTFADGVSALSVPASALICFILPAFVISTLGYLHLHEVDVGHEET